MPFDQIFDAVKCGRAAVGLIIHEGQLTYATAGFRKLLDLGEWWKNKTSLPLPLGGNVLRKGLAPEVQRDLSQIIRQSIDYGLAHREAAVRHSLPYARDMDAALAGEFIGMYVNEYTRDYGESGRQAIRRISAGGKRTRLSSRLLPSWSSLPDATARQGLGSSAFFFAGWAASWTKLVTRLISFWKPGTKSFGPYSKSTTKQKVKNTKSTNQKSVRSRPTRGG